MLYIPIIHTKLRHNCVLNYDSFILTLMYVKSTLLLHRYGKMKMNHIVSALPINKWILKIQIDYIEIFTRKVSKGWFCEVSINYIYSWRHNINSGFREVLWDDPFLYVAKCKSITQDVQRLRSECCRHNSAHGAWTREIPFHIQCFCVFILECFQSGSICLC